MFKRLLRIICLAGLTSIALTACEDPDYLNVEAADARHIYNQLLPRMEASAVRSLAAYPGGHRLAPGQIRVATVEASAQRGGRVSPWSTIWIEVKGCGQTLCNQYGTPLTPITAGGRQIGWREGERKFYDSGAYFWGNTSMGGWQQNAPDSYAAARWIDTMRESYLSAMQGTHQTNQSQDMYEGLMAVTGAVSSSYANTYGGGTSGASTPGQWRRTCWNREVGCAADDNACKSERASLPFCD